MGIPLVLAACSGPPVGRLETVARGLTLAQAPASPRSGPRRDVVEGCDESGLDVLGDAPRHYLALPPLQRSEDGSWARLAQVVEVGPGSCEVVAVFPEDEQPPGSGGGADVYARPELMFSLGFVFDLVDVGDELWLFANTAQGFWRIDPASGVITHDEGLPGFPVGAAADGEGGAWVTTTPIYFPDGQADDPARLWHIEAGGVVADGRIDLPFDPTTYGLVYELEEGGDFISRFVFHPVAVTPSGEVWVLDPAHGLLYEFGAQRTIGVGLVHATGLAVLGAGLVVSSGLDIDYSQVDDQGEPDPVLFQDPGLHWVDLTTEEVFPMSPIPPGPGSWTSVSGFAGPTPNSRGEVTYNVWFPMARVGDDLVVVDPTFGRAFRFAPLD